MGQDAGEARASSISPQLPRALNIFRLYRPAMSSCVQMPSADATRTTGSVIMDFVAVSSAMRCFASTRTTSLQTFGGASTMVLPARASSLESLDFAEAAAAAQFAECLILADMILIEAPLRRSMPPILAFI